MSWDVVVRLAWRNLWRHRRRTGLQLLAIGGAMYLSTCFENLAMGEYEDLIRMGVRVGSGHVAVYRKGYRDSRQPRISFSVAAWLDTLRHLEEVERVFPRLYLPALARSARANRAALVVGVDPEDLRDHPFLKRARCGEGCVPLRRGEALVGRDLAEGLGLRVGKKFVIVVQDFRGELTSVLLRVRGVIRTGVPQMDGQGVFVDRRSFAGTLGDSGRVHEVAVLGRRGVKVEELHRQVERHIPSEALEAVAWWEAMPQLRSGIALDHANLLLMVALIFLIVGVGMVNVMFMSALERVREWGVLRALGMSRSRVLRVVLVEGALLGAVGVVGGGGLSVITTVLLQHTGVDLTFLVGEEHAFAGMAWEPVIYPRLSLRVLGLYGLLLMGIALGGAWLPARWAASLKPAEALRRTG